MRFSACNGEVLATHCATVEKIIAENNISVDYMYNLDECGYTPGKHANARLRSRKMIPRKFSQDINIPHFTYDNIITMMPTISAFCSIGPRVFLFKGGRIPFKNVLRHETLISETSLFVILRGSLVALHEECRGVDQTNFLDWALHFANTVKYLRSNEMRVLNIYDAYRCHLFIDVLDLFHRSNIIVYA